MVRGEEGGTRGAEGDPREDREKACSGREDREEEELVRDGLKVGNRRVGSGMESERNGGHVRRGVQRYGEHRVGQCLYVYDCLRVQNGI